jgi:hypothetical protein
MLVDMSPILLAFRVARFTGYDFVAAAIVAHFHVVLFCELLNYQMRFSPITSEPELAARKFRTFPRGHPALFADPKQPLAA